MANDCSFTSVALEIGVEFLDERFVYGCDVVVGCMVFDTHIVEQVFPCDDVTLVASLGKVLAVYDFVVVEEFGNGGKFVVFGLIDDFEIVDCKCITFGKELLFCFLDFHGRVFDDSVCFTVC